MNKKSSSATHQRRTREIRRHPRAEASLKIKFGNVTAAIFPKGSFPPSLPFCRTGEELDPLADAGGSRSFALLAADPLAKPKNTDEGNDIEIQNASQLRWNDWLDGDSLAMAHHIRRSDFLVPIEELLSLK